MGSQVPDVFSSLRLVSGIALQAELPGGYGKESGETLQPVVLN